MKKNLFFFLLVPMISCAMEGPAGQPAQPAVPVKMRKSLVTRIKQDPTEVRQTVQGLKKIPSDGELARPKIATVHKKWSDGALKIGKLPGEPKHDPK